MNTKRMMRWAIVLFLLAALPVMTAVMAQGQELVGKAPVITEMEQSSPSMRCNKVEMESGTPDVISIGDVVCGEISSDYDMDTGHYIYTDWSDKFTFHVPARGYVLVEAKITDIDMMFVSIILRGNGINESIEEISNEGTYLLFSGLSAGDYSIEISDSVQVENNWAVYELTLSSPLLVSASAANLGTSNVAGISFRSEDILAYAALNNGEEYWRMFFDGSDVGVKTLTNVEANNEDELLFSVSKNQTLLGVGAVTPWDIVVFDGSTYGSDTSGTFRMAFDGSQHQLTASGEKLDAIATSQYCDYLSTTGTATVPYYMGYNIKFKDEDLGCWYQDVEWLWGFESRFVSGLPAEDVFAAAYNDDADEMYLTILGSGKIAGHKVTQKDIFAINYNGYTWGGLVWHGPDHGWNYNIDAVEYNGW